MVVASQTDPTPTIDSQVHAYERDHPERPWIRTLPGPSEVTGDDMVAAMDAVGVDGALLVSPWTMYRFDASYALEVYARHPGRFGLIKPFDPRVETVSDEIAEWAATPGVVGARIMLMGDRDRRRSGPESDIGGRCAARPAGERAVLGKTSAVG